MKIENTGEGNGRGERKTKRREEKRGKEKKRKEKLRNGRGYEKNRRIIMGKFNIATTTSFPIAYSITILSVSLCVTK